MGEERQRKWPWEVSPKEQFFRIIVGIAGELFEVMQLDEEDVRKLQDHEGKLQLQSDLEKSISNYLRDYPE